MGKIIDAFPNVGIPELQKYIARGSFNLIMSDKCEALDLENAVHNADVVVMDSEKYLLKPAWSDYRRPTLFLYIHALEEMHDIIVKDRLVEFEDFYFVAYYSTDRIAGPRLSILKHGSTFYEYNKNNIFLSMSNAMQRQLSKAYCSSCRPVL